VITSLCDVIDGAWHMFKVVNDYHILVSGAIELNVITISYYRNQMLITIHWGTCNNDNYSSNDSRLVFVAQDNRRQDVVGIFGTCA